MRCRSSRSKTYELLRCYLAFRFRQRGVMPKKAEHQAMEARARQLISGEPIDWS